MNILFTERSWKDYTHWQKTDKKIVKRINDLLKDLGRNPHTGIGKPEPLKYDFQGAWSRRIDSEHRLIYEATKNETRIIACRYHF